MTVEERMYISNCKQEAETILEGRKYFEISKYTPIDTSPQKKTVLPKFFQTVSPTGNEVFKHMSLWKSFSFKRLHTSY